MTKKQIQAVKTILSFYYEDEIQHLENEISELDESFEELPIDLEDAIKLIEEKYPEHLNHIAYSLMIFKQSIKNFV